MADVADAWKYRAYIVPVLGKPIAHGDIGKVLATATKLLRDHPSYTIAVRSVSAGRVESRHTIRLSTSVDRKIAVTPIPPTMVLPDEAKMASDHAEVLTVLKNLGITTTDDNPGEF